METKASAANQSSAQNVAAEYPYQQNSNSGASIGGRPSEQKPATNLKLTLKIKKR
jgi:hypothetical protein